MTPPRSRRPEQMLVAAEKRMGTPLAQDLRAWLLQNSLDLPERRKSTTR